MEELTAKQLKDIVIPDGYILIPDPEVVERERKNRERMELEELIANTPKPSDEELIEIGKLSHPYYENIKRLNTL